MLRQLPSTRGATRAVCRHVFHQVLLFSFAHRSPGGALTTFQQGLLHTMRGELTAGLALLGGGGEGAGGASLRPSSHLISTLSLLHSLSAVSTVCAHLADTWLQLLLQLLREGGTDVGSSVLRLLRAVLPATTPASAACAAAARAAIPHCDVANSLLGDEAACPLILAVLLEALGREVGADSPSLALSTTTWRPSAHVHATATVNAAPVLPAADGASSKSALLPGGALLRLMEQEPVCMVRQGTPSGPVATELVCLLRFLQRGAGPAWTSAVGHALTSAIALAPQIVSQLSDSPTVGEAANPDRERGPGPDSSTPPPSKNHEKQGL